MKKFLLPTLLVAMFALPGVASAKPVDVKGPLVLAGKGFFAGELKMQNAAESRPFVYEVKAGYFGVIDLKGDLKVRCQGFEETEIEETEEGKVYFCMGERGRALVRGSHFKFRAFGVLYRAKLAEGTAGQLNGRFVACDKPGEGDDEDRPRLCGWGQLRPDAGQRPDGQRPDAQRPDAGNGNGNAWGPGGQGNGNGNAWGPGGSGNNGNSGERNRGAGNGNGNGNSDHLPTLAELAALLTAQK